MKFSNLTPQERTRLFEEQKVLCKRWYKNNSKTIIFTNLEGTRFFKAYKLPKTKTLTNSIKGGDWMVRYGEIDIQMIDGKYQWVRTEVSFSSSNGTFIPKKVSSKEEALEIAKQIGTLVM